MEGEATELAKQISIRCQCVFIYVVINGKSMQSFKHGDNVEFYETVSSCSVLVFHFLSLFLKMNIATKEKGFPLTVEKSSDFPCGIKHIAPKKGKPLSPTTLYLALSTLAPLALVFLKLAKLIAVAILTWYGILPSDFIRGSIYSDHLSARPPSISTPFSLALYPLVRLRFLLCTYRGLILSIYKFTYLFSVSPTGM